jgi:hypothetical protein
MRLNKEVKVDTALYPAAVSANGSTSPYFSMRDYSKALFIWDVAYGAAGLTTTSTATIYQAKDASALTSAAALASSTAIMTASGKLNKLVSTPAVASLTEGDYFTITTYDMYGTAKTALTYTLTACGTTAAATIARGVIMGTAGGTADLSTTITYMAAAINTSLDGVYGSATTTTLTIRSLNAGETVFLFTASDTTALTITTAFASGMIEVDASRMTSSSNFTHLAINIVNESAYYTSAHIIRGGTKRKNKSQQAAVLTDLS